MDSPHQPTTPVPGNEMTAYSSTTRRWLPVVVILSLGLLLPGVGCQRSSQQEVVIYCALDREFSEQVLDDFEAESGIDVLAKYDVESTKTVGLANAIIAERNRPRCDLFWNNEVLHTLRLKRLRLLQAYTVATPPAAAFRDAEGMWYGFAGRARVLLINTELLPDDERPDSVFDLADPEWASRGGIAKPLFGTTATHAAVLFAMLGEERATEFFRQVAAQGKVLGGNKQVAQAVAAGELAFGLTDTDDALVELEAGRPVAIVFPDQGERQPGTLLIPNTLCLLRGAPHESQARQLAEHIVSSTTEAQLARAASAQIPLLDSATPAPRVLPDPPPRWMVVDFEKAADHWQQVERRLAEIFAAG
jgi:iron(III) transport system substrate-binding protein